jgi:hypothetical protein
MNGPTPKEEGELRLRLADVVYGVALGYGFNILANDDPKGLALLLFPLALAALILDWSFAHLRYWKESERYTFWPFVLDLLILLALAVLMRFAVKGTHSYFPLAMSFVFFLYVVWDICFRGSFAGRSKQRDIFFDALGCALFFLLWLGMESFGLSVSLCSPNWPHFPPFDVQAWVLVAIGLYILVGPHTLGDRIRDPLTPWWRSLPATS